MTSLSTRSRIAVLIVLAALPALGLSVYAGVERRLQAERYARDDLQRHARVAAERVQQITEGVHQLLMATAAASGPFFDDARACQQYLGKVVAASDGLYQTMGIYRIDGRLHCSAPNAERLGDAHDVRHFRAAVESRAFAIGEYQMLRPGAHGLGFGYPLIDGEKNLRGVVLAGLDLKRLNELAATIPLPDGAILIVLDRKGTTLARHPLSAGRPGDVAQFAPAMEALRDISGVFAAGDPSGVARLFALEPVRKGSDGRADIQVLVGVARDIAFRDANSALLQTLAGTLIATLILVCVAWYGSELAILRRLRALLAMTSHIRAGDLTARTRFPAGGEDLCQLGNALDDMAQALQKRDADLRQALRGLSEQVITDPLTNLNNRRYLWDFLARDLIRARRAVLPVAAILFDIDHFKRFNDTWGHEAGDLVLKSVADVIRQNVRGSDIACRYGGEKFIIILSETTRTVAVQRAETIRRDVERMELVLGDKKLRVTASFGVALFPTHANDAEGLVRAADDALYRAKEAGRNRVHVFEAEPSLL